MDIIYTLYLFLFSLIAILVVLSVTYFYLSRIFGKKSGKLGNKSPDEMREEAYGDALRIMDDARVKSLRVLGESQIKAQKALGEIGSLSEVAKKDLNSRLERLYSRQEGVLKQYGEEFIDSYKKAANLEKIEGIRSLTEATEGIKKEVLADMDEFKEAIKKETVQVQSDVEEKLRKNYEEVEKEVSEYKEKKIYALNEKIFQLLSDIAEEVLGKSIDQTEQEKFILENLDKEIRKLGLKHDSTPSN